VETIYWTAIEVYVSVIVPCLPAIRSLLSHRYPKLFGNESQNHKRSKHENSSATKDSFFITQPTKPKIAAEYSEHGDFLIELSLVDRAKGSVSTGVTAGNRTSEEELVGRQGISVSTNTRIEASSYKMDIEEGMGIDRQVNNFI